MSALLQRSKLHLPSELIYSREKEHPPCVTISDKRNVILSQVVHQTLSLTLCFQILFSSKDKKVHMWRYFWLIFTFRGFISEYTSVHFLWLPVWERMVPLYLDSPFMTAWLWTRALFLPSLAINPFIEKNNSSPLSKQLFQVLQLNGKWWKVRMKILQRYLHQPEREREKEGGRA